MTKLLDRHLEKMEAAESAEAAAYRAGLAWAPAGRVALEARGAVTNAEGRLSAAQTEFNRIMREIIERDIELSHDLMRLHNANELTRENVGEGGGKLIKDVLAAETALRKAYEAVEQASQQCSQANGKANLLFRDVLQALDDFKALASYDAGASANRVFNDARKDPDRVADACKTRLQTLGAK